MKKNVASQVAAVQMTTAADGTNFTGTVTVYITGDGGTQTIGSVGSGICTHEGKGLHSYLPAQAETNYNHIAFTYEGTGAITSTVQVYTSFPQTVDNATGIADIQARIPAALTGAGNIKADALAVNGVATTSVTTVSANVGTTQPVNYTGTGASALVKSDTVDIAGAAVSTTTAQVGVNVVQLSTDATAADNAEAFFDGTGYAGTNNVIPLVTVTSAVTGLTPATVHSDLDDIQSRLPAALTSNGNMKASLVEILTTALTETAGLLAGGFKKFFNVSSPTGTLNSIPDAVAGATGGLFIAGTNAPVVITGSGAALKLQSTGGGGSGLQILGNGAGAGMDIHAGNSGGVGLEIAGSSGGGPGVSISTTDGNGISVLAVGASAHGLYVRGGTSGTSDGIRAEAGTGGVDIRGAITGNLTGSVSGSVGSVTGNVGGNVVGTVASVVGAVGSVTGNVGGNVTGTIGGLTAPALKDFFDTDSTTTYASAVAGSVVKEIVDNASGGSAPTVQQIVDGVWDELIAGHLDAGSTGEKLNAAGAAGDPLSTPVPGSYAAGEAGYILGHLGRNKIQVVSPTSPDGGLMEVNQGDSYPTQLTVTGTGFTGSVIHLYISHGNKTVLSVIGTVDGDEAAHFPINSTATGLLDPHDYRFGIVKVVGGLTSTVVREGIFRVKPRVNPS